MALTLSDRTDHITQAEIRVMTIECERVGGVNLAQGVCDLGVPEEVVSGATEAIARGYNSYTRYDGLPELRRAIAGKLRRFNGIDADPETEITVSAGTTGALFCACLALLNPGDEVILFEPFYGYHVNTLLAANAVPRCVTMHPPDWHFDPAELERAVTPRTRAIIVCTPGNPSGKVYSAEELRQIVDIAARHDLFLFTDEIYEYFVYDGRRHVSPVSIDGARDRTIMISGYSKTFSSTGWRMGYSVSRKKWADAIGHVNDLIYVCAPARTAPDGRRGGHRAAPRRLLRLALRAVSCEARRAVPDARRDRPDADGAAGFLLCARRRVALAWGPKQGEGDVSAGADRRPQRPGRGFSPVRCGAWPGALLFREARCRAGGRLSAAPEIVSAWL